MIKTFSSQYFLQKTTHKTIIASIALLILCMLSTPGLANDINQYNAILKSIESLERKIENSEKKQQQIARKINSYRRTISNNKKKSSQLNKTIARHQKRLTNQLRHMQKLQQHSLLKRIANPHAYNQTQRHIKFIQQFPRLHINTIAVLQPLNKQKKQLNSKLNSALKNLKNEQKKVTEIENTLIAKRRQRKAQIKSKKHLLKKAHIATYSRQKTNRQLLQKLERTNLKNFSSLKHFRDYKGKLNWPTQGKIQRSKERRNYSWEILNTQIMPVRAIAPGKIEYIGRLGVLGKVIIINHGGNYRSIYKHLNSIQVKEEQTVQTQQIISQSGKTGGREHYGISFELRHGRKNINFSKWLKRDTL